MALKHFRSMKPCSLEVVVHIARDREIIVLEEARLSKLSEEGEPEMGLRIPVEIVSVAVEEPVLGWVRMEEARVRCLGETETSLSQERVIPPEALVSSEIRET